MHESVFPTVFLTVARLSTFSQLENDLTSPSISTLTDILAALGTNLHEFFKD